MSDDETTFEYRFKIILLGNIDVGKTSLIIRFCDQHFEENIRGEIDQKTRDLTINGKVARIIITDTAGQERFRTLTSSYYRNADAIIVVYDVTNKESFDDINAHIQEGCRYSQRSQKFLVANKIDSDSRIITEQAGMELAAECENISYFETSAKSGEGVEELFEHIGKNLISSLTASVQSVEGVVSIEDKKNSGKIKKKGCNIS
eukprot:TRINITY_DN194_c0_g1_i1.p1 TRINITY_DN194_c0_g1~~TRINITY_DN194_c0_g1_i1.p1  ORF type:complete len:222 (-),score=21.99 TRINITY_DN194_c0_g1_i1:53-664(-)